MPVARKDHRCSFCGLTIERGTEYHCHKGTPWEHQDNDTFFTIKAHTDCWALWVKYAQDWDYYFPIGEWKMIRRLLCEEKDMANAALGGE